MITKMAMNFDTRDPSDLWNAPFHKPEFQSLLSKHGFQVVSQNPDVVFDTLSVANMQPDRPTVVFVRRDASWLSTDTDELARNPNVVGFMVPLVTTDPATSLSCWLGAAAGDPRSKPVLPLTGMLWSETKRHPYYLNAQPTHKDIDVCFIGTMHHDGHPFVKSHRQSLLQNWYSLEDYSSVGLFSAQEKARYVTSWRQTWEFVKRSKVVVSPWGVSEISWRDYEAALGECMIVKPHQPHIDVMATPWRAENVVYCDQDYSDLKMSVANALDKYDQQALRGIRRELLDLASSLRPLAEMFAERLKLMF